MAQSVKTKNKILIIILIIALIPAIYFAKSVWDIFQFNQSVLHGQVISNSKYKFEAKYASAYLLANKGRYQDATLLFNQLLEQEATPPQVAAVQYNLANIYFLRGLRVANKGETVKDEAQFLLNQAKLGFQKSLRLDNRHTDVRHNLDHVLSLLPDENNTGGDKDKLGIIMGNIPTGLP